MSYLSPVDLDLVDVTQSGKAATLNGVLASLAAAALYGIKSASGLTFTLYGGVILIAGTPTTIADQSVTLTPNATNYIYATSAGVVTKTTSMPAGWPGPITAPSGALALYQLVVGAATITSGTSYVPNMGPQGPTGARGAQGVGGSYLPTTRRRQFIYVGAGNNTAHTGYGFSEQITGGGGSTTSVRSLSTSTFRLTIPYLAIESAAAAGSTANFIQGHNSCYLGNGAGRGGFKIQLRWCLESTFAPANGRCFFGLMPFLSAVSPGNVEPSTFTNIIGVGANAGEANLSIMHNDASGAATKTTIVSDDSPSVNFPAKATDNVYDLILESVANSQVVTWRLTNVNTGAYATGTISTNLPSNTTYMTPLLWANNGATASSHAFGVYRMVATSRY